MKSGFSLLIICVFLIACSSNQKESVSQSPNPVGTPSSTLPILRNVLVPVDPPVFDSNSGNLSGTSWDVTGYRVLRQTSSLISDLGISTVFQSQWEGSWATTASQSVTIFRDFGPWLPAFSEVISLAKASNGWIYMKKESDDAVWRPFAPAQVQEGDRWTVTGLWYKLPFSSISGQWTITVVSTQGTPPDQRSSNAIQLEISGEFTALRYGTDATGIRCRDYRSIEYFLPREWLVHRRTTYQCQTQTTQATSIPREWNRQIVEEDVGEGEVRTQSPARIKNVN